MTSPASAATTEPMPSLIGLNQTQVNAILRQDQLFFSTTGAGANTTSWNRVTGQIPAAGTIINLRSTVFLTVTIVAAPVHRVVPVHHVRPPRHFAMPSIIGQSQAYALWIAHHHHFPLIVLRTGVKVGAWNDVLTQYPLAGSTVTDGTRLIVTVERVVPAPARQWPVPHPVAAKAPSVRTGNVHVGVATWYNYVPGHCATWYLPYGTKIFVRDLQNGHTITCVVTDREAARGNRAVDLSETQFSQLAPMSQGVIPVRVWW